MNRRGIVVTAGAFIPLISGCLTSQNSSSNSEESYESERMVETGWSGEGPLVESLSPHGESQYHVAVIESASDNEVNKDYLRDNDGESLLTFLEETKFETSQILALQARHSSTAQQLNMGSLNLEVGEKIEGSISIDTIDGGEDAENRETVFVRIEVGDKNPTLAQITFHENEDSATVSSD